MLAVITGTAVSHVVVGTRIGSLLALITGTAVSLAVITGTAVSHVTIVRLGRTGSWVWPARPAGPAAWGQADAITASGTQTVQYL